MVALSELTFARYSMDSILPPAAAAVKAKPPASIRFPGDFPLEAGGAFHRCRYIAWLVTISAGCANAVNATAKPSSRLNNLAK